MPEGRGPGAVRRAKTLLDTAAAANGPLGKLPGFLVGDVNEVAAAGYRACMNGEGIRVPGAVNLAATLAARAGPKRLPRRVSGSVTRKAL